MGLDGISVNQIRITQENTSKENAILADMTAKGGGSSRSINSLDKKGAVDTDDKENTSFFAKSDSSEEEQEEANEFGEVVEYEKFDLSNKDDFEIKIEDETNSVVIYNKKNEKIVQKITPQGLSELIGALEHPSGAMVNKKV